MPTPIQLPDKPSEESVRQAEYHFDLAVRIDDCARRRKQLGAEDLFAAYALCLAFARDGFHASDDQRRLDWLSNECRSGRVQLLINNVPRGDGKTVRAAIDDAMQKSN